MRYNSDPHIRMRVEEVRRHRKYYNTQLISYKQSRDKIAGMLLEMKRADPGYVFYKICWRVWTESVSLQFILNGKDPKPQEYIIGVMPDGFCWAHSSHKRMKYGDLNQLLHYFETNPLDPEGFIGPRLDGIEVVHLWERNKEVMHHHKFVPEHEDNVDKNLMEMKSGNPNEVFYNVCWFWNEADPYGPGKFSLRFIIDKKPDAHTIVISPRGFVWGTKRY